VHVDGFAVGGAGLRADVEVGNLCSGVELWGGMRSVSRLKGSKGGEKVRESSRRLQVRFPFRPEPSMKPWVMGTMMRWGPDLMVLRSRLFSLFM
jgi:hypothetical protein